MEMFLQSIQQALMIVLAITVLGILIFVHELGHFLFAKWNGIGVLDFSIGFGKKLWKRKIGETTYSLGLIPLGGYVRMVGDDPRAVAAGQGLPAESGDLEAVSTLDDEQARLMADQSKWFLKKGYWAKFWVVFAGPLFNLLFAWFLAIGSIALFGFDSPQNLAKIGEVFPGLPAEKAGLQRGDLVRSVNGVPVTTWEELASKIAGSGGEPVTLEITRQGESGLEQQHTLTLNPTQEIGELALLEGKDPKKSFKIGIVPSTERMPASLQEAFIGGTNHVLFLSYMTVKGLYGMIQGIISPKHIAGPIFIFQQAAKSAKRGVDYLIEFMIFLSVSLAILNLLPIPILDGGHLVFFTLEALRRKPLSLRVQEVANQFGMAVLLLLMVFALGNDLLRLW
ncbi:MAG: RIP metalloprotease RseP [Bdellovibrionota bacterium]|nr:MAG: RIP metalloprotease RseP [Bdellovibrionota bacterium]